MALPRLRTGPFAAIVALGTAAAFCATFFFAASLPTTLSIRVGLAVGAVVGLYSAWETRADGAFGLLDSLARRPIWLRAPAMGLFVFFAAYVGVAEGLSGVVTAMIGQSSERSLVISGTAHRRNSCDRFEVANGGFLFDRALCASRDQLAQAQKGRTLIARGKASPFGLNVESLELGPPVAGGQPHQ